MRRLSSRIVYVHAEDHVRLALTEITVPETAAGAPTFLLLHGFAQNRLAYTLGGLPRALVARGARVLVGEFRGHGLSRTKETTSWTLEHHLQLDIPAMLERAAELGGVERIHVFGHSLGGMLGYATLARSSRLCSLTTFAAPVVLGSDRPLLRLAAGCALPIARHVSPSFVPMDHIIRWLAPHVSRPRLGRSGELRELIRLANPAEAPWERLTEILESADPVPTSLLREMTEIAFSGRAVIDGIDLMKAVAESEIPIAGVIGGRDIFGGLKSIEPLRSGAGPRRIIYIEDAAHVDVTMGYRSEAIIHELWPFLAGFAPE